MSAKPDLIVEQMEVRLQEGKTLGPFSFTAKAGEITVILGPNGSGKTSLLRGLMHLTGRHARHIGWQGKHLTKHKADRLWPYFAYLPQEKPLHWPLDSDAVVALGCNGNRARALQAMEEADCLSFAGRRYDRLSGGEKARVMLARLLASDAPCLLLDEPTAGLDPFYQFETMRLLQTQANEKNKTVIVILHDLSLAARFSDNVILVSDGTIIQQNSFANLEKMKVLEAAFKIKTSFYEKNLQIDPLP